MMVEKESIYSKTGALYLANMAAVSRERLRDVYGLDVQGRTVTVPFLGERLAVSDTDVVDETGRPVSFDVLVVLARYFLMCPESLDIQDDWVAFRDFKDAGPLTVYFRDNVEGDIKHHFSDPRHDLKQAGLTLGGYSPDIALSYDRVMAFDALPHLPLLLLFNFPEDGFPSSCSVLFRAGSDRLLDPESLAILGAVFARKLIGTR